ncbi:hypothetical protein [Nostoc sp. LEGE 06077]|uniref:hypothetical protein n=1 Tax=Nostoc sp. LEGE 06077 TaxID=915325 RepID=UPI001D14D3BF|nr:hypothetical protein [Nostoc sp. LEGE 06077]
MARCGFLTKLKKYFNEMPLILKCKISKNYLIQGIGDVIDSARLLGFANEKMQTVLEKEFKAGILREY